MYRAILLGDQYHLTSMEISGERPYIEMHKKVKMSDMSELNMLVTPNAVLCESIKYIRVGRTPKGLLIYEAEEE